ncbi:Sigma 54 modulation protein / S30EA ribosomal protein [Neorhodopirellula lusitana]|uniref:Sigma 54 modulation protein / S30EA ribosomal protein n=1 Tax=Neorhodopirellula lusitana TaxID=445327 RepID=A0ABY1QPT0_9BACT|nr:HPF/RaiA family ribosome-associated protein [Neorhodopirellula lusitana]SMP77631.1 Sigma 54 modulation protein / S30EA ribosomal protein [Neorhodopirellula lusitana]
MQIQTHTDNHINGDQTLRNYVEEAVEHALGRFEDRITRVEVFLAEEHSQDKFHGDDDKRCVMEVRMRGLKPVSVRHHDSSVKESFEGASMKMQQLIEKTLGKLAKRPDTVSVVAE